MERERVHLNETESAGAVPLGDVQKVRYRSIRTMNVIVSVLERAPNVPEDVNTRILQPLRAAEAKHASKKR